MSPTIVSPDIDVDQSGQLGDDHADLFHVVLLDDDDHTYDYVIEMLQKLFLLSPGSAYNHAVEVDATGRTVILTCEREPAEFAREQVHSYGADWRMPKSQGSMSAQLEPAAG
ncbi:MAG: ATP-dependent Clp protease adaptor ClpS [Bryobacteraceae bacterium]|nr:ATP-dependent Clp protease adaptor ClpS [Bryobacteraceae bacterium]